MSFTAGADYVPINEDLTISAAQPTQSVTVSANTDNMVEGNQQFSLILTDRVTGSTLTTATVVIRDSGIDGTSFGP